MDKLKIPWLDSESERTLSSGPYSSEQHNAMIYGVHWREDYIENWINAMREYREMWE